jgi:UDP-2,4-diacetamido-2,4,6-trideoxy-beta-L-altropyranose hydrolase
MIAIRVKIGKFTGIGHLARMLHLANQLKTNSKKVIFILDSKYNEIEKYTNDYQTFYLYDNKMPFVSQRDDAKLTINILNKFNIDTVIVDSYELSYEWENKIKQNNYHLIAIDDIQRKHNCDIIIDQKWSGEENTFTRYDHLVPENCIKLLGPKYSIIDPQYSKRIELLQENPKLMLSLGGGGDLIILSNLVIELLTILEINIELLVVIGPLCINKEKILELAKKDKRIQTIENTNSLYEYYSKTSLFIGALGTSIYELASLKKPALTFSMTSNQEKDLTYLEDYGHYLHLSLDEFTRTKEVSTLIQTLLSNLPRLNKQREDPLMPFDCNGAKRIADIICSKKAPTKYSYNLNKKQYKHSFLSKDTTIRKVFDSDINHYLQSRNLSKNMQNMQVNTTISTVEHYNWWFNNNRNSYLIEKKGIKELYIWDQKISYKKMEFLIGGWFVCNENTSFDIAAAALQWQLDMTKEKYPTATWIAIIKKSNTYVNTLNKYMGFEEVKKDDIEVEAIKKFFNNPSTKEYNYVKKSI